MTTEENNELIALHDYLQRYTENERVKLAKLRPADPVSSELLKLFNVFRKFWDLTGKYSNAIHAEINRLEHEAEYWKAKAKALEHTCKIHGIDTSFTAYIKNSDYIN